jgi:hypothetical protein
MAYTKETVSDLSTWTVWDRSKIGSNAKKNPEIDATVNNKNEDIASVK